MESDHLIPNRSTAERGVLTIKEVADELRLSNATVYRLMADRRLSFLQLGGARRVTRDQLDAFITTIRVEAVAS